MPQAVVWTAAVPFLTVLDAADPGPRCCRLLSSENSSWLADGHLLPVLSRGLSSRLPFPEEKERARASKEVSKHSGIFSSSHKNQSYYMRVSLLEPHLIFSSVVSDSLWPHGLQHARPPCLSPTPRACSNSQPSSQWCHPTISSSFVPFSSHLQFFPASRSFPMSQFLASGD